MKRAGSLFYCYAMKKINTIYKKKKQQQQIIISPEFLP